MLVYIGNYKNTLPLPGRILKFIIGEAKYDAYWSYLLEHKEPSKFFDVVSKVFYMHTVGAKPTTIVKIHNQDVWNLDSRLSHIIVPALEKLLEDKHGVPLIDETDVPEEFRGKLDNLDPNSPEYMTALEKNWGWVSGEMVWAMKQIRDGETDAYYDPYDPVEADKYQARIERGTTLFGKYFRALWT
jgi:hypothetical protein